MKGISRLVLWLLVVAMLLPADVLAQTGVAPAPATASAPASAAPAGTAPAAQAPAAPALPPNAHLGRVVFKDDAVPGATVTATQGSRKLVTSTDGDGVYRFLDLAPGQWTITIEMIGFAPVTHQVTIPNDAPPPTLAVTLLPFDEISKGIELAKAPPPSAAPATQAAGNRAAGPNAQRNQAPGAGAQAGQGFQRAGVSQVAAPAPQAAAAPPPPADAFGGATDGFVVNGSVNNGAASPFAQLANFGNNRRGGRSLYNYGASLRLGNSAWDARSYGSAQPSYNDMTIEGRVGGPLKLPWFVQDPNVTLLFRHTIDTNANTQLGIMPTAAQRAGDFFGAVDAFGRPIQVRDPRTGQPFAGNRIPVERLSPQALALLAYYPDPNASDGRFNFQAASLSIQRQDALMAQIQKSVNNRNSLQGQIAFSRGVGDSTSIFGFEDRNESLGIDGTINWQRRIGQLFTARMRYQVRRMNTTFTPHFANQTNVSGDAGIQGNNQEAVNWGPPGLGFSSGIFGLFDGQYTRESGWEHAPGFDAFWNRGRHGVQFGASMRRQFADVQGQQDPRGRFTFTGYATGSDFGDFLLGLPRTSSLAFGNADKRFRGQLIDAFISDDIRLGPSLTVNAGLRWEYEAPMTDTGGRLVNLDIAPGFGSAVPVLADNPVGALTGTHFGSSLVRPDRGGIQPRTAIAWRPVPGSSLVVRAGYGLYRNTNVYRSLVNLMSQQPPISRTFSIETSAANPLTLANGFTSVPTAVANTYAIDPNFRVGISQQWQASVQRDLPMSLTVVASYLGTKGHRLMQQTLPNSYPVGAANPCPTCPVGFVYLSSGGRSTRNAGQVQVRRRLRNGLTAQVQYTLAKANDDATAFSGPSLGGGIAQDWQNLDAEWAPSNFDQRHQVTTSFQYSTGASVAGGALVDGLRGKLLKGWTVTGNVTAGSGMPFTPLVLMPVPGTAVSNIVRARLTGASFDAPGYYVNPAAFTVPEPGTWGDAGRNSVRGPSQFTFNAGLTRTFQMSDRLSLDWRLDGQNILNRVTYSGIVTQVGSQQFGLADRANQMRKLTSTFQFRF